MTEPASAPPPSPETLNLLEDDRAVRAELAPAAGMLFQHHPLLRNLRQHPDHTLCLVVRGILVGSTVHRGHHQLNDVVTTGREIVAKQLQLDLGARRNTPGRRDCCGLQRPTVDAVRIAKAVDQITALVGDAGEDRVEAGRNVGRTADALHRGVERRHRPDLHVINGKPICPSAAVVVAERDPHVGLTRVCVQRHALRRPLCSRRYLGNLGKGASVEADFHRTNRPVIAGLHIGECQANRIPAERTQIQYRRNQTIRRSIVLVGGVVIIRVVVGRRIASVRRYREECRTEVRAELPSDRRHLLGTRPACRRERRFKVFSEYDGCHSMARTKKEQHWCQQTFHRMSPLDGHGDATPLMAVSTIDGRQRGTMRGNATGGLPRKHQRFASPRRSATLRARAVMAPRPEKTHERPATVPELRLDLYLCRRRDADLPGMRP